MIRSIVQKVMIKEFSKYIKGIEYNKLTIEVLGGYFSIENIALNHSFFNELETPFQLTYSHIGKLSIQAPLTKLSSVPVACTIEDVYVIAEHKQGGKATEMPKEEQLQKYIKETFELLVSKIKEVGKEAGVMDKLARKVVDNLKLQANNIHIRFQEHNTQHAYAFGLSLESLTFGTTDHLWQPVFVEREKANQDQPVFKTMAINNFKLYWQSISVEKAKDHLFLPRADKLKIEAMRNFVSSDAESIFTINSTIKLKINGPTAPGAQFEVGIDLAPISIAFSKAKMVQLLDFTTSCIRYNESMLRTLLDKALKKDSPQQQRLYRPLCAAYVRSLLSGAKPDPTHALKFAEMLSNNTLENLYDWSTAPIRECVQEQRQKELRKQKKGWFSSAEVQLTVDEKKELQRLLEELAEDSISKGRPPQSLLLGLKVHLSGLSLKLYDQNPLNMLRNITIQIVEVQCALEKSLDKSLFAVQAKVGQVVAHLIIEQEGLVKTVALMENLGSQRQWLVEFLYRQRIKIDSGRTKLSSELGLVVGKTFFTYKKEYWRMFRAFFSLPQIDQQLQNQALGRLQLLRADSSEYHQQGPPVDKSYDVNLSLNSPCFILPLSTQSCWLLDLGRVIMRSQSTSTHTIYPFQLSQLSVRYVKQSGPFKAAEAMKSQQFFPILKDINLELIISSENATGEKQVKAEVGHVQLSATRQEFSNLLQLKKFIVGEQQQQAASRQQQAKAKLEVVNKAWIHGYIHRRGKYLQNWLPYYCYCSSASLYLYPNEKESIPQEVLPLRGARLTSSVLPTNPLQYVLEIDAPEQTVYVRLESQQQLIKWQTCLAQHIHEMKDLQSLILEGSSDPHRVRKPKQEQAVNFNLMLQRLSWNYLDDKGKSLMQIQLENVNFAATETSEVVRSQFDISALSIVDGVFIYAQPQYQILLKGTGFTLSTQRTKQKVTRISPAIVTAKLNKLELNWKPDVLLMVIRSFKQFTEIQALPPGEGNRQQFVESVRNDNQFQKENRLYQSAAQGIKVKAERQKYLRMNAKDEQIYLKLTAEVGELNISCIHRQSHMPMFLLKGQELSTALTFGTSQRYIEGKLRSLYLYELSGYPQKNYDITANYPPFCLLSPIPHHYPTLRFSYSSYLPAEIANSERVDSFMQINLAPLRLYYLQEVWLRLVDYFQIQILLLLTHSEVLTANEDILQQLLAQVPLHEKPRYFLPQQFEQVVKRVLAPFFMDYCFRLQQPQVIMSPTKSSKNYFTVTMDSLTVRNQQKRSSSRFSKCAFNLVECIYEQVVTVQGENIVINAIKGEQIAPLTEDSFSCNFAVNRLLFEDEINEIVSDLSGYDRSFKMTCDLSAVKIPRLSKDTYQDLIRLPNFNLNFEDQQGQLFIHNYRITKTLSPKPIFFNLTISSVAAAAQREHLSLCSLAIQRFQLSFHRDDKLNITVQINFHSIIAHGMKYAAFEEPPVKFELAKVAEGSNYALIKMPNTGRIDVQACMDKCELFLDFGLLPLLSEWALPDDSVFPQSGKEDKLITFLLRLPSVQVQLGDTNLRAAGEFIVEAIRPAGESQNSLRGRYLRKQVKAEQIQLTGECMSIKVSLGFSFARQMKEKQRKLLQRVQIEFKQQDYNRIRNEVFRKTQRRKLNLSPLRGHLSMDDFIQFKQLTGLLAQGAQYHKQFKNMLKSEVSQAKQEEKLGEELVMRIEAGKFYLIRKESGQFLPVMRLQMGALDLLQFVNQSSEVMSGEVQAELSYFNDCIFRWEPIVQQARIRVSLATGPDRSQFLQLEAMKQIYVNLSSQMAVSLKKALREVESKIAQWNEGYVAEEGDQFVSRYFIRNQTGYPLEIFDSSHRSQYVIMHGDQINYQCASLQDNLFEEQQTQQTFSFSVLHPSLQLLETTGIALDGHRSFEIELYNWRGVRLPDHNRLHCDCQTNGPRKVITIRSRKCVIDFSSNTMQKVFYPFDQDTTIVLSGVHRGVKASFYGKVKSEQFLYNGYQGTLTIRKTYLVYNYTVIPLTVCGLIVVPGEFVGVDGSLTIQGIPYRDSPLRVIFNDIKQEYYIYSVCYIIDYANLLLNFTSEHDIRRKYSHTFIEDGRQVSIYLLPDITYKFTAKRDKNSSVRELSGRLSRQDFTLQIDNLLFSYSCFAYLESFCQNNIKDFRKIIQITHSYVICNDTLHNLQLRQVGSIQREKTILSAGSNNEFHWTNKFLKQELSLSILEQGQIWGTSADLPISKSIDAFTIRSKKQTSTCHFLGLEVQQTNNVTFLHIVNAQQKYLIQNDLTNASITIYQEALFSKQNEKLLKDIDPTSCVLHVPPRSKRSYGYQLPAHNRTLSVQIALDPEHFGEAKDVAFTIESLESSLVQRSVEVRGKNNFKCRITYVLQISGKTRNLRFFIKRQGIFKKNTDMQIKFKLKALYLSLIGTDDGLRKEIINACFKDINYSYFHNSQHSQMRLQVASLRIENTLKAEPYFVSLFTQAEEKDQPAIVFALKRSKQNPKLIQYVGFSMRRSVLTVTSEELQILEENINQIMEKLDEKSDTNFHIKLAEKFTPQKIRSDSKLFFAEAEIHPLRMVMTYKHVNNWGGALLKALSINDCKVKVDGKKIKNFESKNLLDFFSKIATHFKEGFENQIFSMIGSLALLGSPLNLATKIGCGIQNLINLPADGFEDEGVLGIGKGLAMGTGSLLSNTVEGAFGSVQSITGTIGNGISGLASYDKNFEKKRQQLKNQRVDHVGEGLVSGGKSIFNGFFTGITGLVTEPIKGAEKEGFGGFLKGGLKGLTGLIVKPVSGVIDATSKTAEGIKNTTKVFNKQTKQLRRRRYNPRPLYGSYREIRTYDPIVAEWNKELGLYRPKYDNMSWCALFQLKSGQLLIITYEFLLILGNKTFEVENEFQSSNLQNVMLQNDKIILQAVNSENERYKLTIQCKQTQRCLNSLRQIYNHFQKNYQTGIEQTAK